MNAVVSWRKDSCLAYYKAISTGIHISHLLNFVKDDNTMTMSHCLPPKIIVAQANELGLPLLQRKVNWKSYEQGFREAITELKSSGVDTLINGDIDLPEGVEWNRKMCAKLGINLVMPLQRIRPRQILQDLVDAGFKTMIVCVNTKTPAKDWLGIMIDNDFIREICSTMGIHPCGELGEYHTLVIDGPTFTNKIELIESKPVHIDGYSYLDILQYQINKKDGTY